MSSQGKQVSYLGKLTQTPDGAIVTSRDTVFVGERILQDARGACSKEVASLRGMDKFTTLGLDLELPQIDYRSETVTCPV